MRSKRAIQALFVVAAMCDGGLGITFLFASNILFQLFGMELPNHPGYVQIPGTFMIVFAAMFTAIARDPFKNRNLIPYGILMKVTFCCMVVFHWLTDGIPGMWKSFCIVDLFFLIGFTWAWAALHHEQPAINGGETSNSPAK